MSDAAEFQDVFPTADNGGVRFGTHRDWQTDAGTIAVLSARMESATHLLRGWIWETDTEHRFTYLSPSVLTFTGRPPEFHYGRTRQELVSYYIEDDNLERLTKQLTNQEPIGPFEYQRINEGTSYWVRTMGLPRYDEYGAFLGYRGVAQDVTVEMESRIASKRLQEEIAASDEVLRAIVDAFPIGLAVFDNECRLGTANALYYSILGLPMTEITAGSSFAEIVDFLATRGELENDGSENVVSQSEECARTGMLHQYRRKRPNGIVIEITSIPLRSGGFIRTYSDITESDEMSLRLNEVTQEHRKQKAIADSCLLEIARLQRMLLSRAN